MRFNERHPALAQIDGGVAIAPRLSRTLQRNEVRRKFHVGRGGTGPALRRIIMAVLLLVKVHLVDVRSAQLFRRLDYHIESKCFCTDVEAGMGRE